MTLTQSTGEKALHLAPRVVLAALYCWNAHAQQIRRLRTAPIREVSQANYCLILGRELDDRFTDQTDS